MMENRQVEGGSQKTPFTPTSVAHFKLGSRFNSTTPRLLGSLPPSGTPAAPPNGNSQRDQESPLRIFKPISSHQDRFDGLSGPQGPPSVTLGPCDPVFQVTCFWAPPLLVFQLSLCCPTFPNRLPARQKQVLQTLRIQTEAVPSALSRINCIFLNTNSDRRRCNFTSRGCSAAAETTI